jgi:hypothetical protein
MKRIILNTAIIIIISLIFPLFLASCDEEQEEDLSISQITISNIPAQIAAAVGSGSNTTFKIYLNASDSQSEDDAPVAKGVAKISDGTQINGKYTVTINLQNPNPADEKDPNFDTGSWSGTAKYFSLMISPQTVPASEGWNSVWVKAGTTLNKGKKSLDWNSTSLMDFRTLIANDPDDTSGFLLKLKALFNDIIPEDPEITLN